MFAILGTVAGLCFFIVPLWAYRRGLKDGLAINQGKPLEPMKPPKIMPTKHTPDPVAEGLANLLAYDGKPQQKAGEK